MVFIALGDTRLGTPAVDHGASPKLVAQAEALTGEVIDSAIRPDIQGNLYLEI